MKTLMFTQVRVDAVGDAECGMFALGVTSVPPEQLTMRNWSEELEDSVIIRHNMVSSCGKSVSFDGYRCLERVCCMTRR